MRNFKNLASALEVIDYALTLPIYKKDLSKEENLFLETIRKRIRVIHHTVNGWKKEDNLIKQFNLGLINEPCQKDLIEESIETYKKTTGFILICVDDLKNEINNEITKSSNKTYINILKQINNDVNSVHDHLTFLKLPNPKYAFEVEAKPLIDFFQRFFVVYSLATLLGATYLPMSQNTSDPLYGESKGFCLGHVRNWSRRIAQLDADFYLPICANEGVFYLQRNQYDDLLYGTKIYHENDPKSQDLKIIITSICKELSQDSIYLLSLPNHAIGIRRIPNSKKIEIFDPNFGIFVFQDRYNASRWLDYLLTETVYDDLKKIDLIEMDRQPKESKESVFLYQPRYDYPRHYYHKKMKFSMSVFLNFVAKFSPQKVDKYYCYVIGNILRNLQSWSYLSKDMEMSIHNALQELYQRMCRYADINLNFSFTKNQYHPDLLADNGLKDQVIKKIMQEVARLKESFMGDACPKINALKLLIDKIENASPLIPLKTIIHKWFYKKSSSSDDETYGEIISASRFCNPYSRTRSNLFIENLFQNAEISSTRLELLRAGVLMYLIRQVSHIITRAKTDENIVLTSGIMELRNACRNAFSQASSFRALIFLLKQNLNYIFNPGFFGRDLSGLHQSENKLYQLLKQLDLDNPSSLIKASDFIKNFEKMYIDDVKRHNTNIKIHTRVVESSLKQRVL